MNLFIQARPGRAKRRKLKTSLKTAPAMGRIETFKEAPKQRLSVKKVALFRGCPLLAIYKHYSAKNLKKQVFYDFFFKKKKKVKVGLFDTLFTGPGRERRRQQSKKRILFLHRVLLMNLFVRARPGVQKG